MGEAVAGAYYRAPTMDAAGMSLEAATGRLHYAGFWIRFASAFIDLLLVGVVVRAMSMDNALPAIAIVYQGLLVGLWNGQTLGKKACGIKVISMDGRPCSVPQAFGRALAKLLSAFTLMIGYIMVGFDRHKRALHDHVAGTLHVYAIQ